MPFRYGKIFPPPHLRHRKDLFFWKSLKPIFKNHPPLYFSEYAKPHPCLQKRTRVGCFLGGCRMGWHRAVFHCRKKRSSKEGLYIFDGSFIFSSVLSDLLRVKYSVEFFDSFLFTVLSELHSLKQIIWSTNSRARSFVRARLCFLGVNIVPFGGQPKQYIIGKRISEAAGSESVTPIACKGLTWFRTGAYKERLSGWK